MAITAYKTWSSGEVLTAADLNSSFSQIINNATSLISPLTANLAAGNFKLTGLAAGSAAGDSVRYEQLPFSVCDFRLTLTSGTPVTTTDVTGATTIYASPYKGNAIGLYDGTNWNVRTSAEFSLALGTLTSGKPYDVFCYDNGGTPTLEFLVWTNDTTRATALTTQNGVLVKTGALTRRYLGTFYTTSTTETQDSSAKRYLWNYYNRVDRAMSVVDATASWAYSSGTVRQANGAATNQLDMVVGYNEDAVSAFVASSAADTATDIWTYTGIGLDGTTPLTGLIAPVNYTQVASKRMAVVASWSGLVGVGRRKLLWLESSTGAATTWYSGSQSGIHGTVRA